MKRKGLIVESILSTRSYTRRNNKDRFSNPLYVRFATSSVFDMVKMWEWEKTIFWHVGANELNTIHFKVYDVNRDDWWDGFAALLTKLRTLTSRTPGPIGGIVTADSDALINNLLLKALAKDAKLLFPEFPVQRKVWDRSRTLSN